MNKSVGFWKTRFNWLGKCKHKSFEWRRRKSNFSIIIYLFKNLKKSFDFQKQRIEKELKAQIELEKKQSIQQEKRAARKEKEKINAEKRRALKQGWLCFLWNLFWILKNI